MKFFIITLKNVRETERYEILFTILKTKGIKKI